MVHILDFVRVADFGLEGIVVSTTKASANILIGSGNILPFKIDQLEVVQDNQLVAVAGHQPGQAIPGEMIVLGSETGIYISDNLVHKLGSGTGWRCTKLRQDYDVALDIEGRRINLDKSGIFEIQAHTPNFASIHQQEKMYDLSDELDDLNI